MGLLTYRCIDIVVDEQFPQVFTYNKLWINVISRLDFGLTYFMFTIEYAL